MLQDAALGTQLGAGNGLSSAHLSVSGTGSQLSLCALTSLPLSSLPLKPQQQGTRPAAAVVRGQAGTPKSKRAPSLSCPGRLRSCP